jgi:zinc/manganese transport system substrate-binding protein
LKNYFENKDEQIMENKLETRLKDKFPAYRCLLIFLLGLAALPALAKIKVAASLPDLASIASYIGGNEVEVFSIAKSNTNPHFVEVLPSYMIKVSRVAVYLKVGLGLDQWADAIIEGSRNNVVDIVDCSVGIEVLEKLHGKADASLGDVHPQGNPHFWLNPENGNRIAEHIRTALTKADPGHANLFATNAKRFSEEAEQKIKDWKSKMAPLKGSAMVTYHSSWVYFAKAYGLRIVGYVEPYPGIPPTARHLQDLVMKIKAEKANLLIQEPYYGDNDPKFLTRQTGIKVFRFTPSCEGTSASDYFKHFETMINSLIQTEAKP